MSFLGADRTLARTWSEFFRRPSNGPARKRTITPICHKPILNRPVMMGRSQSDGLMDAHLDSRMLMFPSVTSMVVASTIFNVKNGLLGKGSQRLPLDSVI